MSVFFLGSLGMNRSAEQNKSPENRFAVHAICLSRATIHSQMNPEKIDTHSLNEL